MNLAYRFLATNNKQSTRISGVIIAETVDIAFSLLRRSGLTPLSVNFDLIATLQHIHNPSFNKKQLARFYLTMGKRLDNGRHLVDGLESCSEFIQDHQLRQAIIMLRQSLLDGRHLHDAMLAAGFDKKDAMVIYAASKSAKTSSALLQLAKNTDRQYALQQAIRHIFRMPITMIFCMWCFLFITLFWLTPKTEGFVKNIHAKVPTFNELVFTLSHWLIQHTLLGILFFMGVPLLLYWGTRTALFKKGIEHWPIYSTIATKADMSTAWSNFALLYEARVPPFQAAKMLQHACHRDASKRAFSKLEQLLQTGLYTETCVERAHFPIFIIQGIKAAASGGNLGEGILDMCHDLEEDVCYLTAQLSESLRYLAYLVITIAIVIFFFITYYPILSITISNV